MTQVKNVFFKFLGRKTQKKRFSLILVTRWGQNLSGTPFLDSQRPITHIQTPCPTLYLYGVQNGDRKGFLACFRQISQVKVGHRRFWSVRPFLGDFDFNNSHASLGNDDVSIKKFGDFFIWSSIDAPQQNQRFYFQMHPIDLYEGRTYT